MNRFLTEALLFLSILFVGSSLCRGQSGSDDLSRELNSALGRSEKALVEFKLSYLEGLKKAEADAQTRGALEELLAIQNERKTYADATPRDYREFEALDRLRKIYENGIPDLKAEANANRLSVYENFLPKFEAKIKELTRSGKLDEALALSKRREELDLEYSTLKRERVAVANAADPGIEDVLWEFRSRASVEKMRDCSLESGEEGFVLKSENREIPWVDAKKTLRPPIRVRVRVKTDSTNIRFYFDDRALLIFNWEVNRSELRFNDPVTRKKYGMSAIGEVEVNKFHDIEINILPEKISVKVNGEDRAEIDGDFTEMVGRIGIGPALGSTVTVKEMKIVSID